MFRLSTDRPDLLSFKTTELKIESGKTQHIGLHFAARNDVSRAEALVFVHDHEGKTEETFVIRLHYEVMATC